MKTAVKAIAYSILSEKLVILLALATMARVSDLVAIDQSSIKFNEEKVSIVLANPRKAQRDGNLHIFENIYYLYYLEYIE
jgi:hypothetical protein